MKPSLIFRIQRWIYFLLKGVGKKETEHYLFTLEEPFTDLELYQKLADTGWTPNYMGYVYQGQLYQARRLDQRGQFQWHLRAYDDGQITAHYETAPEFSVKLHLEGQGLRDLTNDEKGEIWRLVSSEDARI